MNRYTPDTSAVLRILAILAILSIVVLCAAGCATGGDPNASQDTDAGIEVSQDTNTTTAPALPPPPSRRTTTAPDAGTEADAGSQADGNASNPNVGNPHVVVIGACALPNPPTSYDLAESPLENTIRIDKRFCPGLNAHVGTCVYVWTNALNENGSAPVTGPCMPDPGFTCYTTCPTDGGSTQ